MITIERTLGGVVPYRAIFFPSEAVLGGEIQNPGMMQITKLFWTSSELRIKSHLLRDYHTATVCVGLTDPIETILKGVAKNTRYEIRQVEKLGDRVRIRRNHDGAPQEFISLYNDFASAHPDLLPITYGSLSRYLPHADIFMAYADDKLMCGHVLMRDPGIGRSRLLFSTSRRLEDRDTARICGNLNRYLHWYELCAYRQEGFAVYDFGGIQKHASDGISKFKMSFGGEVVEEHTYLCAGTAWVGRIAQLVFENLSSRGRRWRSLAASDNQGG